ncbi:MAG TPA: hypothetical protein VIL20_17100 [Sandaracinaceae bacterium]
MAAKISKTTSDQLKYSAAVETATEQHGETLAKKVDKLVWGDEAAPVSFVLIVQALLALLRLASRALRDADARYGDELSDDDPSRIERDAAADALRALIGNVQHSIVGIYGEVYADHVGLLGSLEPRPDMLARRAERIVRQLRTVPVPEPLLEGASIDIERVAARIDEATARLDRALAEVAKEKSEADAALVERDKAAVHWERVVRLVANFMVGLAEVAGEFGIAARIRPTARRLRGDLRGDELETDVPAEPEGGGDPDPNDPRLNEPS